jgi:NADH-quinone oxidoreductase subunit G
MFTSCCPAWIKYLENENPKFLKNVSTCKSPMEMFAAVIRDKYAAKDAADGRETFNIAIMPCTAKKMEAARDEFKQGGRPDVDLVLTTHEVVEMMQENGIQLAELELESPDMPFGMGTGAANIYGVTGGVAEAVVRHCLPDKSKNALREISLMGLRGDAPFREATVKVGDTELKLAICNGLVNAKKLLKDIEEGKAFYHLIEVMTCAGGCVGGAGQPHALKAKKDERGAGLYKVDTMSMMKRAERNPVVAKMLEEYGEHRCHELLHVSYVKE